MQEFIARDEPLALYSGGAGISPEDSSSPIENRWRILIVDDEEDVHTVTSIVLKDFSFDGKPLQFLNARSGEEARDIMLREQGIAVILLDVVMETENSGLEFVRFVRDTLGNKSTRIILRTGQPGAAPEERVISEYEIDDYKEKSELTRQKLNSSLMTALRSYRHIMMIEKSREELQKIIQSGAKIFQARTVDEFYEATLRQFTYLLSLDAPAVHVQSMGFVATLQEEDFRIVAATESYNRRIAPPGKPRIPEFLTSLIRKVIEGKKSSLIEGWFISYFEDSSGIVNIICVEHPGGVDEITSGHIELFNMNVAAAIHNILLNTEIHDTQTELIFALGEIVETRSRDTSFHVRRVSCYTELLSRARGDDPEYVENIRIASVMHDIGKLGIPDKILLKPGRLTPEESAAIKRHAAIGYDLLRHSTRPIFREAALIARFHHERWDGKGYPLGLKGEDIPLAARIVSIADVFDALSEDRVYRKAWAEPKVLNYLRSQAGKQFDPSILELFLTNYEEIRLLRLSSGEA